MGEVVPVDFVGRQRPKPEELIDSSANLAVSIALRGSHMNPEHLQMLHGMLASNFELLGAEEREAVERLSRQRIDAHLGGVTLRQVK